MVAGYGAGNIQSVFGYRLGQRRVPLHLCPLPPPQLALHKTVPPTTLPLVSLFSIVYYAWFYIFQLLQTHVPYIKHITILTTVVLTLWMHLDLIFVNCHLCHRPWPAGQLRKWRRQLEFGQQQVIWRRWPDDFIYWHGVIWASDKGYVPGDLALPLCPLWPREGWLVCRGEQLCGWYRELIIEGCFS